MNIVPPTVKMEQRRTPLQHLSMNEAVLASPLKSEDRLYMEASLWVEDRTGIDIIPDARHFAEALQDGELLLKIAESVLPDIAAEMKAVHTKESWYEGWNEFGMAKAVENIHIFLSICRAVGVSEHYHFSASDLIKGREIRRVVECLMIFRKIVTPPSSGAQTPLTAQELAAEQNYGASQLRLECCSPKTVVPTAKASNNARSQSNTHETYDSVSEKSIWYSALADAYNNVVEMSPSPRKRDMFSKELSTRKLQFAFTSGTPAEIADVPYHTELAEMMEKSTQAADYSPESAKSLLVAQSPSVLQKRICTTDDVFIVKKFATRLAAKERVVKELVAELSTALQREEALQTKVARLERLGMQTAKAASDEEYHSCSGDSVACQSCAGLSSPQEPSELGENSVQPDAQRDSSKEQLAEAETRIELLNSHNLNTACALKGLKESLRMLKEEFVQAQTANIQLLNNTGSDFERIVKDYIKLKAENKHLRNELQELKGNIRVFCRVRPLISEKDSLGQGVFCPGEEVVIVESQRNSSMNFVYDKVYGPSVTQEHVFMDVLPIVRSVMEGYNVCIFAYGQTGSGKTYTMLGPISTKDGAGVINRSIDLLYSLKNEAINDWDYNISAEIIEIYNESVRDLLGGLSSSYPRVEQRRLDNSIRGLDSVQVRVESTSEIIQLMEIGAKNRAVGATSMNEHSSRSHCIVIVRVEGRHRFTGEKILSSLNLIDLAGSERVSRSEATGDRLKETQHINKSLAALGDVMQALLEKRSHIPFRNSKLTQLLQDSLGGHSKVVMLAHVAPERESLSETVSTLKFASRLLNVELGLAGKNKGGFRQLQAMVVDKDKELEEVKRQLDESQKLATFKVDSCKKELSSKKAEAKAIAARVAVLEQRNKELEQRLEQGLSYESTMSHLQRHSASLNSAVSSEIIRSDMIMNGRVPRYGESGSLSRLPSMCSTTGDASEASSPDLPPSREGDLSSSDVLADPLSSSESELACIPQRKGQPHVSQQLSMSKDFGRNFQHTKKLRLPGVLHSSTNGLPAVKTSVTGGMIPVARVQKFMSKRWM